MTSRLIPYCVTASKNVTPGCRTRTSHPMGGVQGTGASGSQRSWRVAAPTARATADGTAEAEFETGSETGFET